MNNVKKSIGWCDYTINPVKGLCPVGCPYCYARAMYKRFKMDRTIRYDPSVFLLMTDSPKRIFVGSTIDLFHPLVSLWNDDIFRICRCHPDVTFIFLTKVPERLPLWSPYPDNCWVGASCTNQWQFTVAADYLAGVKALVKFISFEPLLGQIDYGGTCWQEFSMSGINWVIIGQQTPTRKLTAPKIEWIRDIVQAADMCGIPVFLKNNLADSVIPNDPLNEGLRQEFPDA